MMFLKATAQYSSTGHTRNEEDKNTQNILDKRDELVSPPGKNK
jgi:hypothetical protein